MASSNNSPRQGSVHLGVYLLVALLTFSVGFVGFMPYSALIMVVPGLLLAVLAAIVWVLSTAYVRAVKALGRRGAVQPPDVQGGEQMLRSIGKVEIAFATLGGLLIAAEVAGVLMGLGPFVTIVTLGYFMVVGGSYLIYRRARVENAATVKAEAHATPWPGVTLGDEYLAVRLSDLLRGLSDPQADRIFRIGRWETLPAGTPMGAAGVTAECIYIIADGAVQLTGQSGLGAVTVRIAREGEAFPLAALIGGGELVTSAKAATDVSVLAVPRNELADLCAERPDIGMVIFRTTAEILGERYRATLRRHLEGAEQAVRQSDVWANV